jgi:hypothetical protein
MFRMPVLLLAVVLSSPALWSAFATGTMSIEAALLRLLIAFPLSAVMLTILRFIVSPYRGGARDGSESSAASVPADIRSGRG